MGVRGSEEVMMMMMVVVVVVVVVVHVRMARGRPEGATGSPAVHVKVGRAEVLHFSRHIENPQTIFW